MECAFGAPTTGPLGGGGGGGGAGAGAGAGMLAAWRRDALAGT